jgi:hemerythrin-like domain-containing protein
MEEDHMTPTQLLKQEHQTILLVIDAAEREVEKIGRTGTVDGEKMNKIIDFLRNFADRCHHAKEEHILFVRMQEKGMPADSGPIFVMLKEHEENRKNVAAMAGALQKAVAGEGSAVALVKDNLAAYAGRLKAHIAKEDNVLYPAADRMFSDDDQRRLAEAFDKVEKQEMGEGVHKKYHELAQELAA